MKQDKDDKKTKKYMGSSLFSTLLDCHYPPWAFAAAADPRATLIPRHITRIKVFAIGTDIRMDERKRVRQEQQLRQLRAPMTASPSVNGHDTELHKAARRGDLDAARRGNGELFSVKDSQGNVPLHLALVNKHWEVASYLVKKYPQGSYVLNRGKESPLYLAVKGGQTDLVDLMLRTLVKDAKLLPMLMEGKPIAHAAIGHQNKETIKTILKYQPDLIQSKDEEGRTPLSYAAYEGYLDTVNYLIKKFPKSISIRDSDRDHSNPRPIHKACLGGHVEVLEIFHSSSPKSLLSVDQRGRNILHLAAKQRGNKLKHVVSYLLNVDNEITRKLIDEEDEHRDKPLALAQRSGNDEVVQLISTRAMQFLVV